MENSDPKMTCRVTYDSSRDEVKLTLLYPEEYYIDLKGGQITETFLALAKIIPCINKIYTPDGKQIDKEGFLKRFNLN